MKKFYFKASLVLLFFFLVVAAAQYFFSQSLLSTLPGAGFHQDDAAVVTKIRADIGSLFQIHLLILLVLGILFFFFFWMVFLRPMGEIRRALDRPPDDSIADRMLPRRRVFHEIQEIVSGIDGLWRQVRGKVGGNRGKPGSPGRAHANGAGHGRHLRPPVPSPLLE